VPNRGENRQYRPLRLASSALHHRVRRPRRKFSWLLVFCADRDLLLPKTVAVVLGHDLRAGRREARQDGIARSRIRSRGHRDRGQRLQDQRRRRRSGARETVREARARGRRLLRHRSQRSRPLLGSGGKRTAFRSVHPVAPCPRATAGRYSAAGAELVGVPSLRSAKSSVASSVRSGRDNVDAALRGPGAVAGLREEAHELRRPQQ
jgi:hypothetical protein